MKIRASKLGNSKDEKKTETKNKTEKITVQKMPEGTTPVHSIKDTILHRDDDLGYYDPCIFEYLEKFSGVKAVISLRKAYTARTEGHRALSFRELDVCERRKIDLSRDFLWDTLALAGGIITEGFEYTKVNPFHLRTLYNKGVKWRDEQRSSQKPEVQKKGDDRLAEIIQALDDLDLPMRDKEIKHGFPVEMCRPEYLDYTGYQRAWKRIQATRQYQKIIDPQTQEIEE